jgi:putative transposase
MSITKSLAREVGIRPACYALDVSRAGFYRWQHPHEKERLCRISPLALSFKERREVLDILHADRFMDKAPREIYATLLDEKSYQNLENCYSRSLVCILLVTDSQWLVTSD